MPVRKASPSALDYVMRRGVRAHGPGFTLYYKTVTGNPRPRIVISQKVDKRAVVRNRIRRRVRAALSPHLAPGRGIVVVCRPEAATLPAVELSTSLVRTLKRFL